MTTTPDEPRPDDDEDFASGGGAPGAEIGMTGEGEGSTFEPEEDTEAQQ